MRILSQKFYYINSIVYILSCECLWWKLHHVDSIIWIPIVGFLLYGFYCMVSHCVNSHYIDSKFLLWGFYHINFIVRILIVQIPIIQIPIMQILIKQISIILIVLCNRLLDYSFSQLQLLSRNWKLDNSSCFISTLSFSQVIIISLQMERLKRL